jgi:pimeloyl-ACP methyl ester carboxylesterase
MKLRMALALSLSLLTASPLAAASVGDLDIHSTVHGQGSKTIIFVHGWTCDETSWTGQVAALEGDYRVVTLDLPGHGQSDVPAQERFSMELFAQAVEAVRAEVGADKVVLVGHSMGGPVIRQYALNHPEHVAGLVAVDGQLDVRPLSNVRGIPTPTREMRGTMIGTMFGPSTSPELREQIRAMMMKAPDATAIGAMGAMFDPKNQSEAKIMAPALTIFAGTNRQAADQSTREVVPNWASVQFEGTGHFVMMEQPEKFNAALRDFVDHRAEF